jgi:hypothetical protein
MKNYGWRVSSAFDFVKAFHPDVEIRPVFYRQLKAFDQRSSSKRTKKRAALDIFQLQDEELEASSAVDPEQLTLRNTVCYSLHSFSPFILIPVLTPWL